MAEQIRLVLTVDSAVKRLIEDAATEYCEGNVSAYVRGLVVFQSLLSGRDTQDADIPGWMLKMFPLQLIDRLQKEIAEYHKTREAMKTFYLPRATHSRSRRTRPGSPRRRAVSRIRGSG